MSSNDVGPVDDFPEGKFRIVKAQDREVGILRWRGSWFAVRNICPHLGAAICAGPVQALLTEQAPWSAELTVSEDQPVIVCPWHNWEFDIRSGKCVTGRERLRTYPVTVSGQRVWVELGPSRASQG